MGILNLAMLSTYPNVCEVLNLMQIEYYFFITNTNKVESNKMITMSSKTFIIKVLIFIFIYLPSFSRLEDDTHIKKNKPNIFVLSKS